MPTDFAVEKAKIQPQPALTFCLAEDRHDCEIGLRLTVLSALRWCPGSRVVVFRPSPSVGFREWLARFPTATFVDHWPWAGKVWNCKPYALQFLLKQGHPEVVWLDADLILANDCRRLFRTMTEDEIGVAEEQSTSPDQGTEIRTRGWQLPVGRKFPVTMNSCVVRVTPRHLPLLRRWIDLLESDEYHRWKDKKKFEHMPPHVPAILILT